MFYVLCCETVKTFAFRNLVLSYIVVSASGYTASYEGMISKGRIGKDMEATVHSQVLSHHLAYATDENSKTSVYISVVSAQI
jgi:hypothetical protein